MQYAQIVGFHSGTFQADSFQIIVLYTEFGWHTEDQKFKVCYKNQKTIFKRSKITNSGIITNNENCHFTKIVLKRNLSQCLTILSNVKKGWQTSRGHNRWHLVDTFGDILWTLLSTRSPLFGWHFVDIFGWLFMDIFWVNFCGHLSSN